MEDRWKVLQTNKKIPSIKEQVMDTLIKNMHNTDNLDIYVGTDSQNKNNRGKKFTSIVSVIAVHIVGKGGRVFYTKHWEPQITHLRDRLLREAEESIRIARMVDPWLEDFETLALKNDVAVDLDLVVHADVNSKESEKSNQWLKEVVGYVTGMGYTCRSKPNAHIASIVADKHVR